MASGRGRRMLRVALRRAEHEHGEGSGELNIVPFLDIVVNLMLFLLATTSVTMAVAQLEVELPRTCSRPDCSRAPRGLELSVTLVDRGIIVAARGGGLAPGCTLSTPSAGLTVPRRSSGHDFDSLGACLSRVHAAHPVEDSVILAADPEVPYEDLVRAMDAIRGSPEAPLFPRIRLSAGVR